jgi:hypothetical protein
MIYIYMETVHELCLLEQNQVISFYTLLKLFSSFLDLFSSNYLVRDPCFCVFYSTLPRTVEGIAFSEKYCAFSFLNCGTCSNGPVSCIDHLKFYDRSLDIRWTHWLMPALWSATVKGKNISMVPALFSPLPYIWSPHYLNPSGLYL